MAVLKATNRSGMGTRKSRALRARGRIPAIMYGHGQDTVSLTLDGHEMDVAVHHGARILEVELDGVIQNVLIKDVQWDTFGKVLLHVDLARVDLTERVIVTVPIVLRGTAAGTNEGGMLQQSLSELSIECAVQSIPDNIHVMVNNLQIGDSLRVRDLELPEGATLVGDADARVCSVVMLEEEVVEKAEEAEGEVAAGPEVIGEKSEDDEESDEATS